MVNVDYLCNIGSIVCIIEDDFISPTQGKQSFLLISFIFVALHPDVSYYFWDFRFLLFVFIPLIKRIETKMFKKKATNILTKSKYEYVL